VARGGRRSHCLAWRRFSLAFSDQSPFKFGKRSMTESIMFANTESSPQKNQTDRISVVFEGAHGTSIPQASLLTFDGDGRLIAAVVRS
jgi:hypothetical protein